MNIRTMLVVSCLIVIKAVPAAITSKIMVDSKSFFALIEQNNLVAVRTQIASHPELLDEFDSKGRSPYACAAHNTKLLELLLTVGINKKESETTKQGRLIACLEHMIVQNIQNRESVHLLLSSGIHDIKNIDHLFKLLVDQCPHQKSIFNRLLTGIDESFLLHIAQLLATKGFFDGKCYGAQTAKHTGCTGVACAFINKMCAHENKSACESCCFAQNLSASVIPS